MTELVTVQYEKPSLPEAGAAMRTASAMVLYDQGDYELFVVTVADVKARYAKLETARKSLADPINAAKNAVQALFKPVLDDLESAERHLKGKMSAYVVAQEQKQRAEQARLDDLARKERERLEKQAAAAAAKGKSEKAETLAAMAAVVTAPVAAPAVAQTKGAHVARSWKFFVEDKAKLVAYVAAHPEYLDLLDVNMAAGNRIAKAMEARMPVEGAVAREEVTIVSTKEQF